jgi:hypothetical protein
MGWRELTVQQHVNVRSARDGTSSLLGRGCLVMKKIRSDKSQVHGPNPRITCSIYDELSSDPQRGG